MKYLDKLNDKQREAALCTEGPLLIVAGAGSGKTATMTTRIAYMVNKKGISPYEILAVTFTNKAAAEMRERINELTGDTTGMWVLTFHSACLRILRKYIDRLNYNLDFTIYDTIDQKTVIKKCVAEIANSEDELPIPYIQKIIGDCKDKGITPKQFKETSNGFREQKIADIYEKYEKTLKKNNALDFDDLILKTVQLFKENKDVLEIYRDRFRYIMVDEYQDTNQMQYEFIQLLAEKYNNICVVGDDDQCIYQWRGANIKNILGFEKDFPGTNVIKLEQNYRSTGFILNGAYSVIRNNTGRKDKKLWTGKEDGEKIVYSRNYNEKSEANFISKEIEKLKGEGHKYSDFAVLYRTHLQSRPFEEAFSINGIPYRVIGGTKFYERKEIKDILSYMKLVQNPKDDVSLNRVINEPKRGVGEKTMEKLEAFAQVVDKSLLETLVCEDALSGLSDKANKTVSEFANVILGYHEKKNTEKISVIYDGLLAESGYIKSLESQNSIEAASRIENLMEFKSVIYDYEEGNAEATLEEFLEKITLMTDIDNHNQSENAVLLMTLHSAKGLEFPIVFMPGMEEGLFPGRRAFDSFEELEEERRLCYVGMTRARERLYLTNAEQRTLYGRTEMTKISKFIQELDKGVVEEIGISRNKSTDTSFMRQQKFNPTEQMKYIRQIHERKSKEQEEAEIEKNSFKAGDKVSHKKFGKGMIVSIKNDNENMILSIVFDTAGIKQLDPGIATLEKL